MSLKILRRTLPTLAVLAGLFLVPADAGPLERPGVDTGMTIDPNGRS